MITSGTTALRNVARPAIAALIGFLAWRGQVAGLCLLPVMIWMWSTSTSRRECFGIFLAYYLTAGRGLFLGAVVFFTDPTATPAWWAGFLIWTVPSAILALVWAIGWSMRGQLLHLVCIFLVLSLPPIGVFGWASPLTAAGALYPGMGWFGLILLFVGMACLVSYRQRAAVCKITGLCLASVAVVANGVAPAAPAMNHWFGIDTQLGADLDSAGRFERLQQLQSRVARAAAAAPDGAVLVLPEFVGGDWSVNALWWNRIEHQLIRRRQTVLMGAYRPVGRSGKHVNMLVSLGDIKGVQLIDRVPVPISMWRPLSDAGTLAFWSGSGIARLKSTKMASLICYEQLLVWPVLVSMTHRPDVLVAAANGWWSKGTSVPLIQRQAVQAWGRLFHVPVVYAANQ